MLTGTLGADAEVKEVANHKVVNFRIAVHKDYKNAQGEKVEKTEWLQANLWKNKDQSTKVAEYLKKGKKVYVEGEPGIDSYLSKEGEAKGALTISVKTIEFV